MFLTNVLFIISYFQAHGLFLYVNTFAWQPGKFFSIFILRFTPRPRINKPQK